MSLAVFAVAFVAAVAYGYVWWRKGHKIKKAIWEVIAPVLMGVLMGACGGLIGRAADALTGAGEYAGDALQSGSGMLDGTVAGGSVSVTQGGAVVVLSVLAMGLIALVASLKGGEKGNSTRMIVLTAVGVIMARTAGGADWADQSIIAAVNWVGTPITDWANGQWAS